tara:strand:- start:386 stop:562 length:177 start_codon:yes stop_codon:yes gene_type:complete
MDWIFENGSSLLDIALKVVGAFAVVASLTPNATDNKIADTLLRIINTLGFNVGNAKNA